MAISAAAKRHTSLGWRLFLLISLLLGGCELTAPAETPGGAGQPYQQRLPLVVGRPTTAAGPATVVPYPEPPNPTVTVGAPQLNVQVTLRPARQQLTLGETVVLTAEVTVDSQDCRYPLYEVSLQESTPGQVEFVSPQVIGPPGESPTSFEVRPRQPGQVSLFARAYGEIDCGQGMYWQYFTSEPLVLEVQGGG